MCVCDVCVWIFVVRLISGWGRLVCIPLPGRGERSRASSLIRVGGEGVAQCWQNRLMRHEGRADSCRAITRPQVATAASWLNGVGDPVAELWWQRDYHSCAGPLSTLGASGRGEKIVRKVKSKHKWYLLLPWGVFAFASERTKICSVWE